MSTKKGSLSKKDRGRIYIVGEEKPYRTGTFLGYRSCGGGKKLPCARGDGSDDNGVKIIYVQRNQGTGSDYRFEKLKKKKKGKKKKRSKKNG